MITLLLHLFLIFTVATSADVEFQDFRSFPDSSQDPVVDIDSFGLGQNTVFSAFGDYDLDGDLDIYVVNDGTSNVLYRNKLCDIENPCNGVGSSFSRTHTLGFEKMTNPKNSALTILRDGISSSKFAKWIDYDKDGDLDLYVVNDGMNRLFINNLFSVEKPYDPFSALPLANQVVQRDSFSYKIHPELLVQMSSEDDMFVVTSVQSLTGVRISEGGLFEDSGIDYLRLNPKPAPGMYLEISDATDETFLGNRYTILDVLGSTSLRLDSKPEPSALIIRYRIITDSKFQQSNVDEFLNLFSAEDGAFNNRVLYQLKVPDEAFSLLDSQVEVGDQIILQSAEFEGGTTLANIAQVDPTSFSVTPPPVLAGGLIQDNFSFGLRRKNGEVLLQKFFRDLTLQIQSAGLQAGDEIFIKSGLNAGKRLLIESVGSNGTVFLDSTPGSLELTEDASQIQYELIYNAMSIRVDRVFKDAGNLFGLDAGSRAGAADSNTRMVKEGDQLLLLPDLQIDTAGAPNAPKSESLVLGSKATFANGKPRPIGRIEVLEIIDNDEIIIDAFPSEVVAGLSNQDFGYQILHQSGRFRAAGSDPTILQFFDEAASKPIVPRNFVGSLGINIAAGPASSKLILSAGRSGGLPLLLEFKRIVPTTLEGYSNHNLELAQSIPEDEITTKTNLEFRPVYVGLGTQDPFLTDVKTLRVFGALPPGTKTGHEIFLRSFTGINGVPQVLNFRSKINDISTGETPVTITLNKSLPSNLVADFKTLCNDPSNTCDSNSQDAINAFFVDPTSQLSVEYEYITTVAVEFGQKLDFGVSARVTLQTSGFSLAQLQVATGDSLLFKDPLGELIFSSQVQSPISSLEYRLENIEGAIDGSIAPFNRDFARGSFGVIPVYVGQLLDFRRIERSVASTDFTSLARPRDLLTFYSISPGKGLTEVATVAIGTVAKGFVQLQRALTFDPNLASLDLTKIPTNPFYFRFTRTTGSLNALPAFVDRRPGIDFKNSIKTNPDDTIRGIALLDVYRSSVSINDPLFKRFRLKSLISKNVVELFPGTLDRETDTFKGYFYEITEVLRDNGGILENDVGNGVFAETGDWNSDGNMDLYILNRATDETKATLTDNQSAFLNGSRQVSTLTTGFLFQVPALPPSDKDNELLNLPSQSPVTKFLSSQMVIADDFDGDWNDDLLILNESDPDRLFISRSDGTVARELFSQSAVDSAEAGNLAGLNDPGILPRIKPGLRGAAVGDINGDTFLDFYFFTGKGANPLTGNQLFLRDGLVYTPLNLPIPAAQSALLTEMETGDAYWSEIIDLDNDGFLDIGVLNNDKQFKASPRMQGKLSVGGSKITEDGCAQSSNQSNRHAAWGDINLDGYPDFYVSRGGANVETNVLCISRPGAKELTSNHFFVFDLIPRDLATRKIENPTRDIHVGTILLTDLTNPTNPIGPISRDFDYRYPLPAQVVVGTGPAALVNVTVRWSEDSVYDYGIVTSSLITGQRKALLQPDDFIMLQAKELASAKSSPLSTTLTTVGPKTTNIEAVGFSILGGSREPLRVESMTLFISGINIGDSAAALEQGLVPKGSVKLYLDGSGKDLGSDDYSTWTPDGKFDVTHDVLVATANLDNFTVSSNIYPNLLDANGKVTKSEGIQVVRANFKNITYTSRNGSITSPLILEPAKDGTTAQKANFLAVLTIDVGAGFEDLSIQALPYLPVKIDDGQQQALLEITNQASVTNLAAFLESPFSRTNEISLRGLLSGQLHKSVTIDPSILGSRDPVVITTFPRTALSFPAIQALTGVVIKVDQKAPVKPTLAICKGSSAIPQFINSLNTRLCGIAEGLSFVQVVNSVSAQPFTSQANSLGLWEIDITGLREGTNSLSIISIDLFGNASDELKHQIQVDISAPIISNVVVTNIGIHKATISWVTNEGSIGAVRLEPLENPGVVQIFNEPSEFNFVKDHSLNLGRTDNLFGGIRADGSLPEVCHVNPIQADLQALCPGSTYRVVITARDILGNETEFSNINTFQTQALKEVVAIRDLDGDGIPDLDSDGDGLPNFIENDPRFPQLDIFDPTDALLDFDGDGVSNVEEFQAGQDMLNPLDTLPIANAGRDQILNPGVVLLDGRSSNLNGALTASVTFNWTIDSVPGTKSATTPKIYDENKQQANFIGLFPGVYNIGLSVATNLGVNSDKDDVKITILNVRPEANAGEDISGKIGQELVLDGSRSFDLNGEELSFLWVPKSIQRFPEGQGIQEVSEARTVFTVQRAGEYLIELIVKDPSGLESRDEITIRVNSDAEVFPIADAGPDLVTTVNIPTKLQGERSGSTGLSANLEYDWQLITENTANVPDRCRLLATDQVLSVNPPTSQLSSPVIAFSKAGIYGFVLRVKETGKALQSAPDCVKILVNESASKLSPIARPEISGTPTRFSQNSNLSRSKVSKAIQPNKEISSIFRVPVLHEVEMSGLDSYPEHSVIAASAGLVFQQATAADNCNATQSAYQWRQTFGRSVNLIPVFSDCSVVRFIPIEPGIHSFELSVNQNRNGVVQTSLPRTIVILVNDPDDEIPGANNFIPSVQLLEDYVTAFSSSFTLKEDPKCADPDLRAAPSITNNPIGPHVVSQSDMLPCTALPGIECLWRQIDGPPAPIQDYRSCQLEASPSKAGTYNFGLRVSDGKFTSLEDEVRVVISRSGQKVPFAYAGETQNVTINETVILDGRKLAGPNRVDFLWSQTKGMPIVLRDSTTPNPSFEPPAEDIFEFELQLRSSEELLSIPSYVRVNVAPSLNRVVQQTEQEIQQTFELQGGGGGGGCFIATAATGSHNSWTVKKLSDFRDEYLLSFHLGRQFVNTYYRYSPVLANGILSSPLLQFMVSLLLYPVAFVFSGALLWLIPILLLSLMYCRRMSHSLN